MYERNRQKLPVPTDSRYSIGPNSFLKKFLVNIFTLQSVVVELNVRKNVNDVKEVLFLFVTVSHFRLS